MKKIVYFILVAVVFAAFACKKESEVYSFYRPTNPQNLKTKLGGELYAFAANDTATVRADYFLKVLGQLKTYGSKISKYGHCWSSTAALPVLGSAFDTIYSSPVLEVGVLDTISFESRLTNLDADTKYYVRSFVITEDANGNAVDTAYNQNVAEISTVPAINEWFEKTGVEKPGGARFDAIAFNLGDTIFFGTGNQGNELLLKDIVMYDPSDEQWHEGVVSDLISIQLPISTEYKDKITDAVGFAMTFEDFTAPQGEVRRCIYVGLGDYGGKDNRDDKSNTLLEWDLDKGGPWVERSESDNGVRSGAVSFVLGNYAYIGTGSNNAPTYDWMVYSPRHDRNGDYIDAWRNMGNNVPSTTPRTGAVAFAINFGNDESRGYFGLGKDEGGNFLTDFYEYRPDENDPVGGSWQRVPDFPGEPRANAVAFVIGDQGYVGTGDNIVGDMEGGTYTGVMFDDFWRYDPFEEEWIQQANYTSNKTDRVDVSKKVTRAVGFALPSEKVGFIGFGIDPEGVPQRQSDLWMYRPYPINVK